MPKKTFGGKKRIYQLDVAFSPLGNIEEITNQVKEYSPMMNFILIDLIDEEKRVFIVQRWCFRGSIDDWITLDESSDLQRLAKTYCCHLGRESFYDLM